MQVSSNETIFGKADVTIDGDAQTNFMVSGYRFFALGRQRRSRFHIQLGFSVPLGTKGDFVQTGGPALTSKGRDQIKAIAPGGIIIGLGFSFGAGRM